MALDKKSYRKIVETTLKAMIELSKETPAYNLGLDLVHYYKTQIEPDDVITEPEFRDICWNAGIELK